MQYLMSIYFIQYLMHNYLIQYLMYIYLMNLFFIFCIESHLRSCRYMKVHKYVYMYIYI